MYTHALNAGKPPRQRGEFCSTACRSAFNNRRKARGAELYDFFMAHRFDRAEAARLGFLQAMNRLASIWRDEDKGKREARRSWRKPRAIMEERLFLKAVARMDFTGRGKR